jgi:hypothetical protein
MDLFAAKRSWVGEGARGGSRRGRRRAGLFATFTAHDSRRGTRVQLYGVTVEVQLAGRGRSEGDAEKCPPFAGNKSANGWPPRIPEHRGRGHPPWTENFASPTDAIFPDS